jgi:hypothetical protein
VLGFRLLEVAALALVVVLALVVPGGERWAPLALAAGPVLAAVGVRQAVLAGLPGPVPVGPEPVAAPA